MTSRNGNGQPPEKKVLLIVPPFQALQTPSLGVSQLKANAQVIARSDDAQRWPLLVTGAWGEGRTAALAAGAFVADAAQRAVVAGRPVGHRHVRAAMAARC